MGNEKKFTFSSLLVTAIVTFIISGIGGSLFNQYLIKPDPSIVVNSIGFKGSKELVEVPQRLVNNSKKTIWGGAKLKQKVDFESLQKYREERNLGIKKLRIAIEAVENWVQENVDHSGPVGPRKLVDGITDENFFSFMTAAILFDKNVYSPIRNYADLPIISRMWKRDDEEDEYFNYHMHFLNTERNIFVNRFWGNDQLEESKVMAESFARGIKENLLYYAQRFVALAREEIENQVEIEQGLKELLLPESHLYVQISLYNSGTKTIAFKPTFALIVDELNDPFILIPFVETDTEEDGKSTDIQADQFLPKVSELSYINVPPDEMVELALISKEKIDQDGEKILKLYEAGILNCSVQGLSIFDKVYTSFSTQFGIESNKKDIEYFMDE